MIYTKDGLTREQLIELLQFSLSEECEFLTAVKPNTNIINDHIIRPGSVISFLKVEEKTHEEYVTSDGEKSTSRRFSVKVLVEDKYWAKHPDKNAHYKCKTVPKDVHEKVTRILNPA